MKYLLYVYETKNLKILQKLKFVKTKFCKNSNLHKQKFVYHLLKKKKENKLVYDINN